MKARPNPKRVAAGRENRKKRRGLSPEGRKRLSEAALANKPWLHSTGPRTMKGKAKAARNGKKRQKGALSIRELQRATAVVDQQIQGIRALLKDVGEMKKQAAEQMNSPLVEQSP